MMNNLWLTFLIFSVHKSLKKINTKSEAEEILKRFDMQYVDDNFTSKQIL